MRKGILMILAALLAAILCVGAPAETDPVAMRIVSCEEQGFSTLCRPEYDYDYHPDGGVTLYLGAPDSEPMMTIFKTDAPGSGFDAAYYFNNVYPSALEASCDEVLSPGEYTTLSLVGRELPGRMAACLEDGVQKFRLCAVDLREDCFVRYEVLCAEDDIEIEQALTALAVAVGNFQPDAGYYNH